MMVRSFDKRLESLFKVESPLLEKQLMNILAFNLKDNANSYTMQEDGTYLAKQPAEGEAKFNIHQKFFQLNAAEVMRVKLVADRVPEEAPDTSTAPNTEA
jgi:polyphosphate kinase